MNARLLMGAAAFGGAIVAAFPAFAHITLLNKEAKVGGSYMAVFRVPHGCDGSATTKLRVQIPSGVIGAKPQPHAGWKVDMVTGKFDQPIKNKDTQVTEGVKEVSWSGGNLPDSFYDEFVLQATLADSLKPNSVLYFPVVQECEKGVDRWIEIPAEGKKADDYKTPAPGVRLVP